MPNVGARAPHFLEPTSGSSQGGLQPSRETLPWSQAQAGPELLLLHSGRAGSCPRHGRVPLLELQTRNVRHHLPSPGTHHLLLQPSPDLFFHHLLITSTINDDNSQFAIAHTSTPGQLNKNIWAMTLGSGFPETPQVAQCAAQMATT